MIAFSRKPVNKLECINCLPLNPFVRTPLVPESPVKPLSELSSIRKVSQEELDAKQSLPAPIQSLVEVETLVPSKPETLADYYVPYEPQPSKDQNNQHIELTAKAYAQHKPNHPNNVGLRTA